MIYSLGENNQRFAALLFAHVLATVRDKHGKIISSLGKDDFVLEEDGRSQTINYFVRESDQPLRLGLLVDTSLSQAARFGAGTQHQLPLSRSERFSPENASIATTGECLCQTRPHAGVLRKALTVKMKCRLFFAIFR